MSVLVLGSNGMAGHLICRYLISHGIVVDTLARENAHIEVDLQESEKIRQLFTTFKKYDFVINCVGLLVSACEASLSNSLYINSYIPRLLEATLASHNTKIIHISTDCIYSGSKQYGYFSDEIPDATYHYGVSKAMGEIDNKKDITFRTSIIGPEIKKEGSGLLHWFLKNNESRIPGWTNHYWNGITTLELAKKIHLHLLQPEVTGVYNLVDPNFKCSKYDMLCLFNEVFQRSRVIEPVEQQKPTSKLLLNRSISPHLKVSDFRDQLLELKQFMARYEYTYEVN